MVTEREIAGLGPAELVDFLVMARFILCVGMHIDTATVTKVAGMRNLRQVS